MRLKVFDSLQWTYPDSRINGSKEQIISLDAARGTTPSFQIFSSKNKEDKLFAECSRLSGSEGSLETSLYKLIDVPVERNTGRNGFTAEPGDKPEEYTTRPAPFRVHDPIAPLNDSITGTGNAAFFVSVIVPVDAVPGKYEGVVKLYSGSDKAEVKVCLKVYKATVPEKGRLKVTNWFAVQRMAQSHNLKPWSEEHWEMIRSYAELMKEHRQNMFRVTTGLLEINKDKNGLKINFPKVDRYIKLFLDAGFDYIEGIHLGSKGSDGKMILKGLGKLDVESQEGYHAVAELLTKWYTYLNEKGYLNKYYQHIADEPQQGYESAYRILAGIIRKFMPGVPFMDAVESLELAGSVDVWIPQNHYYEGNRKGFEKFRKSGDELWQYTCCKPGGKYLNRFLDVPLIRTCLLHWGNYLYDLDGYLHWGLNRYKKESDPFRQSARPHRNNTWLPAGDTHIIYPGDKGPLSSVRLEAMKEGIEDYELFKQLEEKEGRKSALDLTKKIVRGFKDFTEDISLYRKVKKEVLKRLS